MPSHSRIAFVRWRFRRNKPAFRILETIRLSTGGTHMRPIFPRWPFRATPLRLVTLALMPCAVLAFGFAPSSRDQVTMPPAHFHHLHLNTPDPKAAIDFYTSKFDCEKGRFAGAMDGVWAQKSWLLFTKVSSPPPWELTSAIWHFGWGAEDMKATYQKQLDMKTRFFTPITELGTNFFYAYVESPDHALIELNTANHHNFGHLHLFSEDPVSA